MNSKPDILGASILIVDDQESNVALLTQLLTEAGYTSVTSTMDPTQVGALHAASGYDLILLDVQMPGLDGFGVMAELAAGSADAYLPVIVLTADTTPETLLRAVDEGATDFLTKPFNATEIVIRIRNLLQTRVLYRELKALR